MAVKAKKEQNTEKPEVPSVNVPLQVLADVVNLIDVASTRGAWRGGELAPIGSLREQFVSVLDRYNAEQREALEAEAKAKVSGE